MPTFVDVPTEDHWDPETCDQPRFEDWTGLDSLVSPLVGAVVMFAWSAVERCVSSVVPEAAKASVSPAVLFVHSLTFGYIRNPTSILRCLMRGR